MHISKTCRHGNELCGTFLTAGQKEARYKAAVSYYR